MVSLSLVGWCGCDPHSRREATPAYKWGDSIKENEVNKDEAREFAENLDRESAWLLFDALEAHHDIKVIAFTRQDIEYAIGFDGWKMTDEEWQKFSTSYYWRKGIDEQVNYAEIWDWARDAWEELGFELPEWDDGVVG